MKSRESLMFWVGMTAEYGLSMIPSDFYNHAGMSQPVHYPKVPRKMPELENKYLALFLQ